MYNPHKAAINQIARAEVVHFTQNAINHVLANHLFTELSDTTRFETEIKTELEKYAGNYRMFLPIKSVKLEKAEPFTLTVELYSFDDNKDINITAKIITEEN